MSTKTQVLENSIDEIQELKKEIREIKEGWECNKKKQKMYIPGHRIGITNRYVRVIGGRKAVIPDLRLPEYSYTDLVAPTGHVILKDGIIKVLAVCFINKDYKLEYNDFTFYYDFSFNSIGDYLLNLFITFNKHEMKAIEYKYYSFEFEFEKGAIHCADGCEVPMEKIKTVQLFLINEDPETSRGTETTVQSGDDT